MESSEDILQIIGNLQNKQCNKANGLMIANKAYHSAYYKVMTHPKIREVLSMINNSLDDQNFVFVYQNIEDHECKVILQILADLRRRCKQMDYDIYDERESIIRAKEIFKLC